MRRTAKLIPTCLILAFLLTILPAGASAATIIDSGYCGGEGDGTNLTWTLDSDGVLTISGEGEMKDCYESGGAPWEIYRYDITAAVLQDGVTTIGTGAFSYCESLTSVAIPDSVTTIENDAFNDCEALTSVTIPAGVTAIGATAFGFCSSLTEISVNTANPSYKDVDGVLFSKDGSELIVFPYGRGGSYTIPDGVTTLTYSSFFNCLSLTALSIPSSVKTIETHAFYASDYLTDVYYSGSEKDWAAISVGEVNEALLNATIHYGSNGISGENVLPTATQYVPYSVAFPPLSQDGRFSLSSGRLPDGLSLSADGVISGIPTELGVFSFTVRETASDGICEGKSTLSVFSRMYADVEANNVPGYGFVETAGDDGRVQDQTVTSAAELTDQVMHLEGAYPEFRDLYLDARKLVRGVEYEAASGSTKLTVYAETIGDEGGGTHTLAAEFDTAGGEKVYTVQNYRVAGIASREVHVTVRGETVIWTDAEPYIDTNSRTMTPFRVVGDALGLEIGWDGTAKEASFSDGAKTIYFPIGSTTARTSEGRTVEMDTSAVIVNGRTYAPVRYLAEFFGYTVAWDRSTRTVVIG